MNENMRNDVTARMSTRLLAVAGMLESAYVSGDESAEERPREGDVFDGVKDTSACKFRCVADVGCDHGYVSIYLVQKHIADRAIAMDVRKGPLSMARENIALMGLSDRIDVRLSEGLTNLKEGEADGLVIAGMGGRLIMSILEQKDVAALGIRMALLQPQSELALFREYLAGKGYRITDERIVLDDGKYYFPMMVSFDKGLKDPAMEAVRELLHDKIKGEDPETVTRRLCSRYGAHNILRRDALLKSFLEHGREVAQSVIAGLNEDQHPERFDQLKQELKDIDLVCNLFKGSYSL